MTDRIVDLSSGPARLSIREGHLRIDTERELPEMVPLGDLAVLVVAHPRVSYTHAVLSGLSDSGAVFVACNNNRLPVGLLLPLDAHYHQVSRFALQAAAPLPKKKRVWQQIVRAKIANQAAVLKEIRDGDHGLGALVPHVRSGDPTNVEARAARRYWPALFANRHFRRDREREDQNQLLNYGYAVLRAIVARAACAAGLHPGLGVHHHNRAAAYPLADDLMEPYRPIVDRAVVRYVERLGPPRGLDKDAKRSVLEPLLGRFTMDDERRTVFDMASRTASSLVRVCMDEGNMLALPSI